MVDAQQSAPALLQVDGKTTLQTDIGLLSLDFVADKKNYLRALPKGKSELIAKAIGMSKGCKDVIDATLGLAQDAVVLARLGCRVRGIERSPWVLPLLQDALARAQAEHSTTHEWVTRLQFLQGNAIEILRALKPAERPQVVYLDPMFPGKTKDALPRKEMQIFRAVVGGDLDSEELFRAAMSAATDRVVVKRPLKAPTLGGMKPMHQFVGNTVRFDLYTPEHKAGTL